MVLPQSMKAKCTMKRVKVKHTQKRTSKSAWEMCDKLQLARLQQRVEMLEEAVCEPHKNNDRSDDSGRCCPNNCCWVCHLPEGPGLIWV